MVNCERCGQENPAPARFCSNCGEALAFTGGSAPARKVVTIVFADLSGSTELGERLDPESLRRIMVRYFDAVAGVFRSHGGAVEKFIGDAVVAVFGVPLAHEDDALRAVRSAAQLHARVPALGQELTVTLDVDLRVRVGVSTGEVLAAAAGAQGLVGDAFNVAARLQQAAAPGQTLLGPATYELVRDAVDVEPAGALRMKGKSQPVPAWRLRALRPAARGRARRFDARFVGRVHELTLVDWVFGRVVDEQTCHLVTVLGSAGIGKSRLAMEALRRLAGRATVLTGACPPYGEGTTYQPLLEVTRQAAGLAEADDSATVQAKLTAALGEREDAPETAAALATLLGIGAPTPGAGPWAARKFLEALAGRHPVVVVLDDLHWAQPAFLDLVEHVADWSRQTPLLLLCLARPELLEDRPGWGGGKVNATSVLLQPLAAADSAALLDGLIGARALEPPARTLLLDASGGHPLYLEELWRALIDAGLLRPEPGRWVAAGDLAGMRIPPSVQALLAARLDRLPEPQRDVLERGAVLGARFALEGVVATGPPGDGEAARAQLQELVRRQWLRADPAGQDAYAFLHALVRDAVYAGVSKATRAGLHERAAEWLSTGSRQPADELVARHLEQALAYRRELGLVDAHDRLLADAAADRLDTAADAALTRGDMPSSAGLLRRAVDLLGDDDARRGRLLVDLAAALTELGDFAGAEHAVERAVAVAERLGDACLRGRAVLRQLWLRSAVDLDGWADDARREAERLLGVFTDAGDAAGAARAWAMLAEVHYLQGRIAVSEDAIRRGAELAAQAGDTHEVAESEAVLAYTGVEGPLPVPQGIARAQAALQRHRGDRTVEARVLQSLALLHAMAGEPERARRELAGSVERFTDLGQRFWLATCDWVAARVALLAGDIGAAEPILRRALEGFERLGEPSHTASLAALTAEALEDAPPSSAQALVDRSRAVAGPDDVEAQIRWRVAQAQVRRRATLAQPGGTGDAGVAIAREAVAIAARTDALNLHAGAVATLAACLSAASQPVAARDAARQALGLYERKGNTVMATSTRTMLAQL